MTNTPSGLMSDEDVRVLRGVPSRWAASQRPMSRVLLEKAADEIDRLRAEVERLESECASLREWAEYGKWVKGR